LNTISEKQCSDYRILSFATKTDIPGHHRVLVMDKGSGLLPGYKDLSSDVVRTFPSRDIHDSDLGLTPVIATNTTPLVRLEKLFNILYFYIILYGTEHRLNLQITSFW
jgi:hypothetical protein